MGIMAKIYDVPKRPGLDIEFDEEMIWELDDDAVINLIEILVYKLQYRRVIRINNYPRNIREAMQK